MSHKTLVASAPGSLMLLGEHAVLYGHPAIVMNIENRVFASLTPLDTSDIQITTPLWNLSFPVQHFPEAPYSKCQEYVLSSLKTWVIQQGLGSTGISLNITSDFEPGVGLGSSTAVVVATLKALNQLRNFALSPKEIFLLSLKIIRKIQGMASGADIAASLYEGTLFYQQKEFILLPVRPLIEWKFSGTKVPTQTAIEHVNAFNEDYRDDIFEKMRTVVLRGRKACEERDAIAFAACLKANQKLMMDLLLDTPALKAARYLLEQDPSILASKISGAGLGDGVIGFKGFA